MAHSSREQELWDKYHRTGAIEDRNALVEAHRPLLKHIAFRSWNKLGRPLDTTVEDLESLGVIGLIRAVNGFDPSQGFAFSTYAWRAINTEIMRSLNVQNEIPTYWTSEDRKKHGIKRRVPLSTLQDKGYDPSCEDAERAVYCRDWFEKIGKFLHEREHRIIKFRYQDGLTLEETAAQFGVTRERIRQLESRAMRRLRRIPEPALLFENEQKLSGLRVSEWSDDKFEEAPSEKEIKLSEINPLELFERLTITQVDTEIDSTSKRLEMLKTIRKVLAARDGGGKIAKKPAASSGRKEPDVAVQARITSAIRNGATTLKAIAEAVGMHHLTVLAELKQMGNVQHDAARNLYSIKK